MSDKREAYFSLLKTELFMLYGGLVLVTDFADCGLPTITELRSYFD